MAKFTLVVDSSQISTFLECPQKWYYHYVKRLEPAGLIYTDEAMNAGTYGHKLLEVYYHLRAQRLGRKDILGAVDAYDPDTDTCECGCAQSFHCPTSLPGIEKCVRCAKCSKFRPHSLEIDSKEKRKVQRRVMEYIAHYWDNDFIPAKEQDVEVGFSEVIYEDTSNKFVLEGRIDLIATKQGLDCFVDHKFQTRSHFLYNHTVQLKNYSLVTGITTGFINYIRLMDKPSKVEQALYQQSTSFPLPHREMWKKRLIQIYFRMKKAIESPPKDLEHNWNACSGGRLTYDDKKPQYCWYTELCEEIILSEVEKREKTNFKIQENIWRPW